MSAPALGSTNSIFFLLFFFVLCIVKMSNLKMSKVKMLMIILSSKLAINSILCLNYDEHEYEPTDDEHQVRSWD